MEITITNIAGTEYYIGNKTIKAIQGKVLASIRNMYRDDIHVMINDVKVPVKYTDYVVKFDDNTELCLLSEEAFNVLISI